MQLIYLRYLKISSPQGYDTAASVTSLTMDSQLSLDQGFAANDDIFAEGQACVALNSQKESRKSLGFICRMAEKERQPYFC